MGSKVEALVRTFLRSDADALYLVPGERIFMMRGTGKAVVGREPLSEDSLQAVVTELVPGTPSRLLSEAAHRLTFRPDPATDPVEVTFGFVQGFPALMMARLGGTGSTEAQDLKGGGRSQPLSLADIDRAISRDWRSQPIPVITASQLQAAGVSPPIAVPAPPPVSQNSSQAVRHLSVSRPASGRPIDEILFRMVELQASDVHLSAGQTAVFRIHGELVPQREIPRPSSTDLERLLSPIFPESHRKDFTERNDADFAYEIEGLARFRVNVFRDRNGVAAVFRLIPIEIQGMKELELPSPVFQLADLQSGLVLVTGATGSGKSTTLAALLERINETRSDHIITVEDPIEFVHMSKRALVNQREVGIHTRSFAEGLQAALRADPDVIFVSKLKDGATLELCLEIAEAGHLVFGSMHTTSVTSTLERVADLFPAERRPQIWLMLADSLRAVVTQTLCRKMTGGRTAAFEVLLNNPTLRNVLRDGKAFQIPAILQASRQQGMTSLNDSLVDLVLAGLVEPKEAYLKAADKSGLINVFRSSGIRLPDEDGPPPRA